MVQENYRVFQGPKITFFKSPTMVDISEYREQLAAAFLCMMPVILKAAVVRVLVFISHIIIIFTEDKGITRAV